MVTKDIGSFQSVITL